MENNIRDTIARVAQEEGIDPAYALAVADKESSFNPNARASKSIAGLYQMTGDKRFRYGAGDSPDVATQTRAFARFTKDLQGEMRGALGRDPNNAETYLGHFWGGNRAARVIGGQHADMAPSDVFSARELAENPQLARGSTAGGLAKGIMADIGKRSAKYGANYANPMQGAGGRGDFAAFGQPLDAPPEVGSASSGGKSRGRGVQVASNDVNFAQFGQPLDEISSGLQSNFERNKAYTKADAQGFNTDLGADEGKFRQWMRQNKVRFDADATGPQDYDMRGFYKALQSGDAKATSAVNPNDHKMHYPDYWKTPYHNTFSAESQWADPAKAPKWNEQDQLVTPDGTVQFDERAKPSPAAPPVDLKVNNRPGTEIDLAQFGTPAPQAPGPDFSGFGTTTG